MSPGDAMRGGDAGEDAVAEARRVMEICNACRYCEGYCAVFPAMERRRAFARGDLDYLANLCHDCRACHYACQYAPPHEFAVNLPRAFSEMRRATYRDHAWPRALGGLFARNGLAVALITAACLIVVLGAVFALQEPRVLFAAHAGAGAFYAVIPYAVMLGVPLAASAWIVAAFVIGFKRFWRSARGTVAGRAGPSAFARAVADVLTLRYLDGGGAGCTYPAERFSGARRWFHQVMLYGFLLAFAATSVAAVYDRLLAWPAPYPFLSLPVILGTLGGAGLVVGPLGLLWLKRSADPEPADPGREGMDIALLVLLLLTGATGLIVLAVRHTGAMGTALAVHLGFVLALFVTLPYGKFVHAVYRFAALLLSAMESRGRRS